MRTAWAGLLLLGVGCFDAHAHPPERLGKIGKLFGGAENVETVESPARVLAWRLRAPSRVDGALPYNQWPLASDKVAVPADAAARLSRGLTSESTYNGDEPKACEPRPGFLVRFAVHDRTIDVAFCLDCGIVFTYWGTHPVWYANIDGSIKPLAKLLLQAFPGDPDLLKFAEGP